MPPSVQRLRPDAPPGSGGMVGGSAGPQVPPFHQVSHSRPAKNRSGAQETIRRARPGKTGRAEPWRCAWAVTAAAHHPTDFALTCGGLGGIRS